MSFCLKVGVKNLHVCLDTPCSISGQQAELCLTFSLDGDFLPAATLDNLEKTVDYFALSQSLTARLSSFSCSEKLLADEAFRAIFEFSPLITGCYLNISASCHSALIVSSSLLRA